MTPTTRNKINACKNLEQYLNVLEERYFLAECKPGKFSKNILIQSLSTKLQNVVISAYAREKAVNAENMQDFLKVVRDNFDLKTELTKSGKEKLLTNTGFICSLVMLKEKPEPQP